RLEVDRRVVPRGGVFVVVQVAMVDVDVDAPECGHHVPEALEGHVDHLVDLDVQQVLDRGGRQFDSTAVAAQLAADGVGRVDLARVVDLTGFGRDRHE